MREMDIRNHLVNIRTNKEITDWKLIETDELLEGYAIVPFVPKDLNVQDCNDFRTREIAAHAKKLDPVGVNSLAHGTLPRILVVQERWFNATHQDSNFSPQEKQSAINEYMQLKDLLKTFLDADLERNINGEPTIFGFPLGQANLSDGQKVLIQLCLAIHCQQKSLDDLILFLDEPENHLHPSVIIETIARIINKTPHGQIWISTHSIPLLSPFHPSPIWFMVVG